METGMESSRESGAGMDTLSWYFLRLISMRPDVMSCEAWQRRCPGIAHPYDLQDVFGPNSEHVHLLAVDWLRNTNSTHPPKPTDEQGEALCRIWRLYFINWRLSVSLDELLNSTFTRFKFKSHWAQLAKPRKTELKKATAEALFGKNTSAWGKYGKRFSNELTRNGWDAYYAHKASGLPSYVHLYSN
jgi:hypothetical protein